MARTQCLAGRFILAGQSCYSEGLVLENVGSIWRDFWRKYLEGFWEVFFGGHVGVFLGYFLPHSPWSANEAVCVTGVRTGRSVMHRHGMHHRAVLCKEAAD